jgi:hypothetical protein
MLPARDMTDSCIIIEGVTEDGRTFRPSDWVERLSGTLSTFGPDQRLQYSRHLQPRIVDGRRQVMINCELREENPEAFRFLLDFARANRLRVILPTEDLGQPAVA